MPYIGPNDPALPAHVAAAPVAARRQWIAVFEQVLLRCMAEGRPRAVCEGDAMRTANGVLARRQS